FCLVMFRITEKRELFRIQWNSQRQFLKSGEDPFLISYLDLGSDRHYDEQFSGFKVRNFGLLSIRYKIGEVRGRGK
ncbi:MAG: hypothetical protein MUE85_25045, partial [Microscillaceae bacterium]|nr:hypothetical protein [Microscillaceae bacterium]